MKAMAIVCEYNPLHTGHVYHMQAARQLCDADTVIGIMSGCFVQRAEPAVISPATRALAAIRNGMDAVIELPAVFSCGNGETFAQGAIGIMSRIPQIKYIAMGVEDNENLLQQIAEIQCEQSPAYRTALQSLLNDGMPYPVALTEATASAIGDNNAQRFRTILRKPNNVLAVEYLKNILRLHLDVQPVFVQRRGNDYNDATAQGEYISATAARMLLAKNDHAALAPYVPNNCLSLLTEEYAQHAVDTSAYNALCVHALRTGNVEQAYDVGEGLQNKLTECARQFSDMHRIVAACKSKRYTFRRIQRICLQTLLGIDQEVMRHSNGAAGRLIAIKKSRKDILRELHGIAVQNNDYTQLGSDAVRVAQTDGLAGSIYALITHRDGNAFWDRKLITE